MRGALSLFLIKGTKKMRKEVQLEDDRHCFACGMDNPEGLRIEWAVEGKTMTAQFTPEKKFQGWKGIAHGGIIATLLDEAMTRLAWIVCGGALTAEMTVRYVLPVPVGEPVFIRGEIVAESRKLVEMKASLSNGAGQVLAHAIGKAIKV